MEISDLPELPDEPDILKKCYTCEIELLENLNIVYNSSGSFIVTWNRFQIFVYEDLNLESTARVFLPEFQVRQLIISNNYVICLDTGGNIHTTCMKFKNSAQKRFKSSFQPREQSVLCCIQAEENVLSLRHESGVYFLCQNKVNSEFTLEKKLILLYSGKWPLPRPVEAACILATHKLKESEFAYVVTLFNEKEDVMTKDCSLIIMSFDKLTVYGCLFSSRMSADDTKLVQLYTCPSEICNFEILFLDELYILIGLSIGTLVKLPLKSVTEKPDFVHLNTALHKFRTLKDTVIYTDGQSMWKTDSTFTENISFSQFFVRHVKDFIRFGDQIVCTTFTNLIYMFSMDEDSSYIKSETANEYCSAEKLLNNSEYLHKIIEELEKNNELIKKINDEGNFVTAFSLSNRQDIMENIIQQNITVYECFEDFKAENVNVDVILTEQKIDYFDSNTFFILVKMATSTLQHMFNNILSNLFNDVKIHITLSTEQKILKTVSIKIKDAFKKIQILIPINIKDVNMSEEQSEQSEIYVNVEFISSIPGALDAKQRLWVSLYRKKEMLSADYFIRTTSTKISNFSNESIEELVLNVATAHFGGTYKFTDTAKYNLTPEFSVYLKLPQNFMELFKTEVSTTAVDYLNKIKVSKLMKIYTSEAFLRSNSSAYFEIGNSKAKVDILNDEFTSPVLKVSCTNMAIALHIKNLFFKIIYGNLEKYGPEKEFIKYLLYSEVENLQKEITSCLRNGAPYQTFEPIAENFERFVIGALPL